MVRLFRWKIFHGVGEETYVFAYTLDDARAKFLARYPGATILDVKRGQLSVLRQEPRRAKVPKGARGLPAPRKDCPACGRSLPAKEWSGHVYRCKPPRPRKPPSTRVISGGRIESNRRKF